MLFRVGVRNVTVTLKYILRKIFYNKRARDREEKKREIKMKPGFLRTRSATSRSSMLYRRRTALTVTFLMLTIMFSIFLVIKSKHFQYRHQIQIEKMYFSNKNFARNHNAYLETIEGKGDQNIIVGNTFLKQFRNKGQVLDDTLYNLNKRDSRVNRDTGKQVRYNADTNPIKFRPEKNKQLRMESISKENKDELILKKLEELSLKVNDISLKIKSGVTDGKKRRKSKATVINQSSVKKCKKSTILFLVTSHSSNTKRRAAIRNNWGFPDIFKLFKTKFDLDYQVYFSVGLADNNEEWKKTNQEAETHQDILIVDRNEDFYDLTRRVMAGFEWAVQQCDFTYLFKMDDDIFINIPNVMNFISNSTIAAHNKTLYAGDMNIEALVNRDPKSKYRVTYKEWPTEIYPPYCSGGGFIISRGIIEQIIPYFDWEDPFKIDDAYIGILIQRARISNIYYYVPEDDDEFWFYSNATRCHYRSKSLVYHKVGDNACMQRLTSRSYLTVQNIVYGIQKRLDEPKSIEALLLSVKVPFGYARNLAIQKITKTKETMKKLPSLDDLPKAATPVDQKKKQRQLYIDLLKSRLNN